MAADVDADMKVFRRNDLHCVLIALRILNAIPLVAALASP